jgi:hypothetical protein
VHGVIASFGPQHIQGLCILVVQSTANSLYIGVAMCGVDDCLLKDCIHSPCTPAGQHCSTVVRLYCLGICEYQASAVFGCTLWLVHLFALLSHDYFNPAK